MWTMTMVSGAGWDFELNSWNLRSPAPAGPHLLETLENTNLAE
jgi:hypothetical protein